MAGGPLRTMPSVTVARRSPRLELTHPSTWASPCATCGCWAAMRTQLHPDFDGDGRVDTASLATKMSDVGGCPQADMASNILGDRPDRRRERSTPSPDRSAASWTAVPFMAIDLDDDGDDEFLVQQLGGAILGLVPYGIADRRHGRTGGSSRSPVTPPGDPRTACPRRARDLLPGRGRRFLRVLDCRGSGAGRVLVATTGQLGLDRPADQMDDPPDDVPAGQPGTRTSSTPRRSIDWSRTRSPRGRCRRPSLCGIPFPPNPAFETP